MAFPILGEIEKLINERGSAAIMKERLSLAADQYSALEKKLSEANIRIAQLESENKSLHLNFEKAKTQIRDFEEKLVCSHKNTIEEVKVKILVFLSSVESNSAKEISISANCGEAVAIFHLEELKEKGMVTSSRVPMLGDYWSLEQPGRRYLIENNLIK